MSSVMDNRSNWLCWQVHPSSFINNCWDWWLQFFFFCNRRPLQQSCVGGCCDRKHIKGERTLISRALSAGCRISKTFLNVWYLCGRITWLVANGLWIIWVFGLSLSFWGMMLLLDREQSAKQQEMKIIFLLDCHFQKLWMFIYNQ